MKSRRMLYGMMGLLSLLGFIGIFTEARVFLAFFAFAVDFEYFFIKSDEMMEQYMDKSASMGFYCGMAVTALSALVSFVTGRGESEALLTGLAAGWVAAVLVHGLSTVYYGIRERWGLVDDNE